MNGPNPKHLQQQMLGKRWSNRNPPSLLVGIQNGILEESLSFLKIYTLLPYDLAIVLLWYFIQMS